MQILHPRLAALLLCTPAAAQVLISYDAGTANNPFVAPDPITQGWTLMDFSGGLVDFRDVSPDGTTGLNAWQVDDQACFPGGNAHYSQQISADDVTAIESIGFELEFEMRLIYGTANDIFFEFASGTHWSEHRYMVMFAISGADVIATNILAGTQITCPGAMDGNYHTYTIRRGAAAVNVDAEFLFDGVVIGTAVRSQSSNAAPDGGVNWGAGTGNPLATANVHSVTLCRGGPTIGTRYCTPAVPNSSGDPGHLAVFGNENQANGAYEVRLFAIELPTNQFGYFIGGQTQGFIPFPGGSQGYLCMSIRLARFVSGLQSSGTSGVMDFDVDVNAIPFSPPVAIAAGDTWYFQAWFRDNNPGPTSNFTDAVSITFQ